MLLYLRRMGYLGIAADFCVRLHLGTDGFHYQKKKKKRGKEIPQELQYFGNTLKSIFN